MVGTLSSLMFVLVYMYVLCEVCVWVDGRVSIFMEGLTNLSKAYMIYHLMFLLFVDLGQYFDII